MSSWFDSAIEAIAPRVALRRAQARLALRLIQKHERKYQAASKGRRTDGWITSGTSVNSENFPALAILRDRSRDLVRNNPYAGAALGSIVSNVIGTGIVPQIRAKSDRLETKIQDLWSAWGESTLCDADGLLDFYGLTNLALQETVEAGEVILRRRWRRSSDNLPVPFQIQMLEADHLDTSKNESLTNGGKILQGVEFDVLGRRVAYWLFPDHPGETGFGTRGNFSSERVDAKDIIHNHRVDRAGQVRGIPWGARSMLRMQDFDEYEDAQLIRQKIAACFTAFVHDMDGAEMSESEKQDLERFEPGMIENLPAGKQITFANPPTVTGYKEFSDVTLHAIAAGYGVPYEELTGDLSGVNFSSGRMGWIAYHRRIEQWRWFLVIPRVCKPIYGWFLEGAALVGTQTSGVSASWTPPRREMIDPTKEVPAKKDEIRSGLITPSEALRERGMDPKAHFNEMKSDFELIDKLGLVLDCDPRKINGAGGLQGSSQSAPSDPTTADAGSKSQED